MKMIAIDPGDKYTGVAFFESGEDPGKDSDWQCVDAIELSPEEFEDSLMESLIDGDYDVIVYERFRLYGDKSREQKGSEFRTAQTIGVIKFLCRVQNAHAERHQEAVDQGKMLTCELQGGPCADPDKEIWGVECIGQMADIKKPTAGILRHKGIKSVAKPIAKKEYDNRDHVVDAELHGWKWILDTRHGRK